MEKVNKCSCFEESFVADYVATRSAGLGDVLYRKECRCRGTKEQDACSCGGDELKCDFYPEKREPKLCPCCNEKAEIKKISLGQVSTFCVSCNNCFLQTPYCDTKAEAIRIWNRREGERK